MRRQHGPHSVVPLVNPFTKENMLLCCETNCFLFLYFSGARHALNTQLCAWRDIFRSGYILCWLVVIPLLPYVPPPPQATHTCCTCMWMNPWEWQRLPCISTHSSTASMQHIRIGYMHVFAVHSPNPKAECTNPTQAQVHAPFVLTTTTRGLRMHFKIVLFHLWTSDSLETDFKLVSCSISDMGFFFVHTLIPMTMRRKHAHVSIMRMWYRINRLSHSGDQFLCLYLHISPSVFMWVFTHIFCIHVLQKPGRCNGMSFISISH